MKKLIILFVALILSTAMLKAQSRDRRVDLDIKSVYKIDVSATGQLWVYDRTGHIWKADSIGATWRTMLGKDDETYHVGPTIERMAFFGSDTAIAAGYMHDNTVLRTITGGEVWDTVEVDRNHTWVHGFCFHPDGKLWMTSSSGRELMTMAYSSDRGMTFTSLKPSFPDPVKGEDGIEELFMMSADSGFAGTYGNRIYSTSDNWRTAHRIGTPQDQGLVHGERNGWVTRLRVWHGWLIATQARTTAYTSLSGEPKWKSLPICSYETDLVSDRLWAITDSGQLVLMQDMEHWTVLRDVSRGECVCGVQGGCVYISSKAGVVRIAPDGKADTCGFFTEETTIQDHIDQLKAEDEQYGMNISTISFSHGGRRWLSDRSSIYLNDLLGLYRVAKPENIVRMFPDPDRDDRVIVLLRDQKNYTVDTSGRISPYTYSNPFGRFLENGLQGLAIETYTRGCFHYRSNRIVYSRRGVELAETDCNFKKSTRKKNHYEARQIEEALKHLGEDYSQMPTPADFGLGEEAVDLEKVFNPGGWCTTSSGYIVTFVNGDGDTLTAEGDSGFDCGEYFPMLLPMFVESGTTSLVTYRPELWNALKPLMPENMFLRGMLSRYSLVDVRPGDLLFFRDTAGMGAAVEESTGQYTHVAIVESVDDSVWVVDATPSRGVSRHAIENEPGDIGFPVIYRLKNSLDFDIDAMLARARSFIGRPYDQAFEPGTKALYCSELVYECFLKDYSSKKEEHLFKAKPMNWRDADGNMPQYWIKHFEELGKPIPEGVPGTNPTDLSLSPLLRKR